MLLTCLWCVQYCNIFWDGSVSGNQTAMSKVAATKSLVRPNILLSELKNKTPISLEVQTVSFLFHFYWVNNRNAWVCVVPKTTVHSSFILFISMRCCSLKVMQRPRGMLTSAAPFFTKAGEQNTHFSCSSLPGCLPCVSMKPYKTITRKPPHLEPSLSSTCSHMLSMHSCGILWEQKDRVR